MPCEYTDLGVYDVCDPVDLSATIDGSVTLTNLKTGRSCDYDDGNFGTLTTGSYVFNFNDADYLFRVL